MASARVAVQQETDVISPLQLNVKLIEVVIIIDLS